MSFITEHIIPGKLGKTFLMGSDFPLNYQVVVRALGRIQGVQQIKLDDQIYPHEITVWVDSSVPVKEVQTTARELGFHAIPKAFLFQ